MEESYLPKGYRLKEYQIERVLGAGGFGITYLAIDTNLNTQVVIKEFLPREFSSRESSEKSVIPYTKVKEDGTYDYFLKKFLSEAQILASIKHPNIVRVFSFFNANNTAYFVMDYIKGESLKEYLARKGNLDEESVLSIIIPILEGLKEVHDKNYLHRDIAPDNIYLRQNGMPMLIDFGTAKNTGKDASASLATIVKAGYSAPEQYVTTSSFSPATDIYAVGSVMYSMISGKIAPEATQRQMALLNQQPDPLGDIVNEYKGKYSKELLETIQKAMSVKDADRFQNVLDMQKSITQGIVDEVSNTQTTTTNSSNNINWKNYITTFLLLAILAFGGYKMTKDNRLLEEKKEALLAKQEAENLKIELEREAQQKIEEAKRELERQAQEKVEQAKREAQEKVNQIEIEANRKIALAQEEKLKQQKMEDSLMERLRSFFISFLSSGKNNNEYDTLKFYSFPVIKYFNIDNATKADVLADKRYYYKRWKYRKYTLIDMDILSQSTNKYYVKVTFSYRVQNNIKTASGTSMLFVNLEEINNQFYITKIQEKIDTNYIRYRVFNVQSNDVLNVRLGASAKYKKIAELPYNARDIEVLEFNGNWCKIRYKNIYGWVNSKYLVKEN